MEQADSLLPQVVNEVVLRGRPCHLLDNELADLPALLRTYDGLPSSNPRHERVFVAGIGMYPSWPRPVLSCTIQPLSYSLLMGTLVP